MIVFDRVSKSYDGGRTFAVREVSLCIAEGAFVAVVGASGSGKTTLLKMINRLVEPDRGSVSIAGATVDARDPAVLRRGVGYVFQGVGLFPHMSVAENIGVTPSLLGWPGSEIAARVDELLDLVDLPRDYGGRPPDALSGGQRQRVGLARALAARPKVLLLDEPFGALDAVTREALGEACRRLHDALGLTTVMITHDVLEAALLADRIVVMGGGEVLGEGTAHELFSDHPDPRVRALMESPRRQAERVAALMERADG
ncbi:MAG: ATP-binding cassette domain-containing protein [Caulobacteraceae bacterium]